MGMKKLILLTILLVAPLAASAQDYPGKWEIDLFAGVFPWKNVVSNTSLNTLRAKDEALFPNGSLARIYEPDRGRIVDYYESVYPYVGLRFGYRIVRWVKVGSDVGWSYFKETCTYFKGGPEVSSFHTITVIPKVTFFFATSKYVSAYAGVGMGAAFNVGRQGERAANVPLAEFAWQVTPIGITVGRRVPGYTELTVGKDVIGIKFGVGYRF